MSNIRELKVETDVKEVLANALEQADGFTSVIIIADKKNNEGQWIRSSSMTGLEKSYLATIFNAWICRWAMSGMEDGE